MDTFSELIYRLKSCTPTLFKKIRAIGVVITTICTPILAAPSTYTGAIISDKIISLCSHLLIAGVVMISIASLAKKDESKSE